MQERRTRTIYKLYNKNFIALQLNIEYIRNELCHYRGPSFVATLPSFFVEIFFSCFSRQAILSFYPGSAKAEKNRLS